LALRLSQFAMPLQVAAVPYRCNGAGVEFLLVRTRGGNKWTFPKGDPERSLTHSQAAEREAHEEAGVRGAIERKHFHLYLHTKGVFWKGSGVREYVVKAFLLEVHESNLRHEAMRMPAWFVAAEAKQVLAKGREVKYAKELCEVIERAEGHIRRVLKASAAQIL
jgi:8-oxo-dGTP pyrophosphatase MutT (NUDIX family)